MNLLSGYKTYIAAFGIVVTGLVGFFHGDTTLIDSVVFVLNGLGLASLRNAVS